MPRNWIQNPFSTETRTYVVFNLIYLIQKQLTSSSDFIRVLGIVKNLVNGLEQIFRGHGLERKVDTVSLMSGLFPVGGLIAEHRDNNLSKVSH